EDLRLPMDALASVPGSADPREVLRRLALEFVPFIENRIGEVIVSWMRRKAASPDAPLDVFDPRDRPNPPQRALPLLTSYLRRAPRRLPPEGRLERHRAERPPRGAFGGPRAEGHGPGRGGEGEGGRPREGGRRPRAARPRRDGDRRRAGRRGRAFGRGTRERP